MNAIAQCAIIAGLTLAAAGASWMVNGRPTEQKDKQVICDEAFIKQDEICLAQVPDGVLWVDARPRAQWEKNGLKGSILWNMDPGENDQAFEANVASQIFQSQPTIVVVYCESEACGTSRAIAERIRALDLGPEVKILFGGWDALRTKLSNLD